MFWVFFWFCCCFCFCFYKNRCQTILSRRRVKFKLCLLSNIWNASNMNFQATKAQDISFFLPPPLFLLFMQCVKTSFPIVIKLEVNKNFTYSRNVPVSGFDNVFHKSYIVWVNNINTTYSNLLVSYAAWRFHHKHTLIFNVRTISCHNVHFFV